MKKLFITAILFSILFCIAFGLNANAAEIVDSGKCGANATYAFDSDGVLTISGSGDMYDYDNGSSYSPWYSNREIIKTVIIENGVTSIGKYTFENCAGLTDITLSESVASIGDGAFDNCNSLTDVYYSGTEEQWKDITIGDYNECLTNATIHFATAESEIEGIYLERSSIGLVVGGQTTLVARVLPDNELLQEGIWSTSNEAVATVDNTGLVSGIKLGKALITVATPSGEHQATCEVTVARVSGGGGGGGGGGGAPIIKPSQISISNKGIVYNAVKNNVVAAFTVGGAGFMIAGVYDGGTLVSTAVSNIATKDTTIDVHFEIPVAAMPESFRLKAFMWNNAEEMKPISEIFESSIIDEIVYTEDEKDLVTIQVGNPIMLKNDKEIEMNFVPVVMEGSLMVSARAGAEALNMVLSYDGETKELIGEKNNISIRFSIDGSCLNVTYANGSKGQVEVEIPFKSEDGTTIVPIEAFAQIFGDDVTYDEATQTYTFRVSKAV